jgi:uncharacterized protein YecA (UPF0149 family)
MIDNAADEMKRLYGKRWDSDSAENVLDNDETYTDHERYYAEKPDYGPDVRVSCDGQITRIGPKIGRNDLCPCGSGKKYKKCCMP